MAWTFPEEIEKETNLSLLDNVTLEEYHDQMHIFWKKRHEGYYFNWTFKEIQEKHREVVLVMLKKGIRHIHPIDSLDKIPPFKEGKSLQKLLKQLSHLDKKIQK